MKHILLVAGFATIMFLPSSAQGQLAAGAFVGAQLDNQTDWFMLGGEVRTTVGDNPFVLNPRFDLFLQEFTTEYQVSVNVMYPLELEGDTKLKPFAAAGPVINYTDFDGPSEATTRLGLNVVGGAHLRTNGNISPYFQGQYSIINNKINRFIVSVGAILSI